LENEFSKEEQSIIEEGDGILEEVTTVLGRTTETDGNDAKQEALTEWAKQKGFFEESVEGVSH